MNDPNLIPKPERDATLCVSDLFRTIKKYAVAVTLKITVPTYWWRSDETWRTLDLYFIESPTEEIAKALAIQRATQERQEKFPIGDIEIHLTSAKEVPNKVANETSVYSCNSTEL